MQGQVKSALTRAWITTVTQAYLNSAKDGTSLAKEALSKCKRIAREHDVLPGTKPDLTSITNEVEGCRSEAVFTLLDMCDEYGYTHEYSTLLKIIKDMEWRRPREG